MPLNNPQQFVTWHGSGDAGGYNPLDSTVYFAGTFPLFDPSSNYGTNQVTALMPSIIRSVQIRTFVTGAGTPSTNQVTFAIRVNNTTDIAVGSQAWNASTEGTFTGLSIPIGRADTWAIKWTTPAWSTNPLAVYHDFLVLHEQVG